MTGKKPFLNDWLYRNNYGYIYEEYLTSPEKTFEDMTLEDYLKKHHPNIWSEYSAQ